MHRHVDGTLVFVDVSGFTALSERLAQRGKVGAEQLTDVLNVVFGTMLGLAAARGGTLLKFGGDALFLLFTGPDHAVQASCAAVEMRSALAQTAKYPSPAGRLRLRMSVGVHTGEVDLFLVGRSHRELVIVGPATTAVAELEATASAGQILLGPRTAAALPRNALGEPLGPGCLLRWRRPHADMPEPHLRPDGGHADMYVPTALRRFLSAAEPESEHRTVGVSFVRYTGIDGLLDREGHQPAAQALHALVLAAQDAADAEGVTFLATDLAEDGGKVIMVAGFPTTAEDDQGRLLRATRSIVTRSLDEAWPIAVRAGVSRGHVFAGAIGSFERATLTVMGDTVNLAARVMAKAEPGQVLATPATLDAAQTLFSTQAVEPFMVKGKSRPVTAYVVGEESGTRPPRGLGTLPFLGRDKELQQVDDAYAGLAEGRGRVVTIAGEAGIGKTRLLREVLAAHDRTPSVQARAEPYGAATPYRPLRDPLRRLLGLDRADAVELSAWLAETVPLFAPDLEPWLPLIGDVLAIPVADTDATRDLDPQFRPDRTADALFRLIEVLAGGPMVIALDDAHYADEATAALLSRLERETESRPWLLLAARRDEDAGYRPTSGEQIPLGGLHEAAVRSLVIEGTAAAPLRPHDLEAVVNRVAGNPLFLEETLRGLREHGDIDALPSSLEGMVAAQIDSLSPLARRVVRRASVLGRSFRVAVLKDLFGDEEVALDDATRKELADILEPDGKGRLRFRHALLRDAAYDSLPFQRRRQYHLLAADSTLKRAGNRPEEYADNLALHFSMGGDHEQAWRWGRAAANQARAAYANAEAVAQYERALAAATRIGYDDPTTLVATWEALGDSLLNLGRYPDAVKAFGSAHRVASDGVARAKVLIRRARANERAQRHKAAYRDLTQAAKIAHEQRGRAAARVVATAVATRAQLLTLQDRHHEAEREALEAIRLAEASDDDTALARAYMALDSSMTMQGRSERGTYYRLALPIHAAAGDLEGQSTTMSNLGAIAYFDGRWDEAADLYRQAAAVATRMGDVSGAAVTQSNLGEVLLNQGHYDEAEPVLLDALRVLTSTGLTSVAGFAAILYGRLLTARGHSEDAHALLDTWREKLQATGHPDGSFEAATAQAEALVAMGDGVGALRVLDEAERDAADAAAVFAPMAARARALALSGSGHLDDATAVARAGLVIAEEQGLFFESTLLRVIVALTDESMEADDREAEICQAADELTRLGVTRQRIDALTPPPRRKAG